MSLVHVLNDPPKHGIERKTFVLAARRGENFSFNRVMKLTNDRMPDRIRDGVHSLRNGECPMLGKRGNVHVQTNSYCHRRFLVECVTHDRLGRGHCEDGHR